jgi:hypothetical protein
MVQQPGRAAYLATTISLDSAAVGVVAALAWNAAITELFEQLLPGASGIVGLFADALVVTTIAVAVTANLAKAAEQTEGTAAR